jgi:hypothetical protein
MLRIIGVFVLGFALGSSAMTVTGQSTRSDPAAAPALVTATHLRLFTIDKGRLDEFSDAWVKTVYAQRTKMGMKIPFAAKIPATNQFVWLITYSGREPFEKIEQAYYNSPERKQYSPNPQQWIARNEPAILVPVIDLPAGVR